MTERHYRDKVKIDLSRMEDDLRDLARDYAEYAEPLAEAHIRKTRISRRISFHKAMVQQLIEKKPKEYGLERVTDKSVEAAVERDSILQNMYRELDETNNDISFLSSATRSFELKKKALEKLTDLYLGNYWIRPKVPEDLIDRLEGDALDQDIKRQLNAPDSPTVIRLLKKRIGR